MWIHNLQTLHYSFILYWGSNNGGEKIWFSYKENVIQYYQNQVTYQEWQVVFFSLDIQNCFNLQSKNSCLKKSNNKISITSVMQMTPPLWQKVKRNSKASWWKWKRRVKKLAKSSTFRKLWSWHSIPSLHGTRMGKSVNSDRFYFLGFQNHCRWWLQPWN